MVQNRNKLINLFIGNISNCVVHRILEKAIDDEDISNKYDKESINSFNIAKKYREKINPINSPLPDKDIKYIKSRIINKVKTELLSRISKNYKNINLDLVESFINNILEEIGVI